MNCEEIEKEPSVSSESISHPPQHFSAVTQNIKPCTININYENIENVLLSKLQAAVISLQETNSTEITIHQCQVIKACSEAVLAVRRLAQGADEQ